MFTVLQELLAIPGYFGHFLNSVCMHSASFFTGFTASEAGAVLISEGARAGFKDCTLNLNSASGFGAVLDIRTDAGAWMQACTMSSITDAGTRLVDGTRGIATAPGAKYFNDKDFHRGVDQSGQLVEPLPLDGNAIVELGFLVGQAQQYEQIAEVCVLRSFSTTSRSDPRILGILWGGGGGGCTRCLHPGESVGTKSKNYTLKFNICSICGTQL